MAKLPSHLSALVALALWSATGMASAAVLVNGDLETDANSDSKPDGWTANQNDGTATPLVASPTSPFTNVYAAASNKAVRLQDGASAINSNDVNQAFTPIDLTSVNNQKLKYSFEFRIADATPKGVYWRAFAYSDGSNLLFDTRVDDLGSVKFTMPGAGSSWHTLIPTVKADTWYQMQMEYTQPTREVSVVLYENGFVAPVGTYTGTRPTGVTDAIKQVFFQDVPSGTGSGLNSPLIIDNVYVQTSAIPEPAALSAAAAAVTLLRLRHRRTR